MTIALTACGAAAAAAWRLLALSAAWVAEPVLHSEVDSADGGKAADFTTTTTAVRLDTGGEAALLLTCLVHDQTGDSQLNVGVLLAPEDEEDSGEHLRIRHISGRLKIGDRRERNERWMYNPQSKRLVPHDRAVARKIFNAAIRGDAIRLKALGGEALNVALPEMNDDFRTFATGCPATKPR